MFEILSKKYLVTMVLLVITYGDLSWALPSYMRLWEKKYGYSTSCTLCHSKGGGSQLGAYGEDYQRFGMTPAAFVTIESRDSDKDGSTNVEEILAKSNPGDAASTPKNTTDWLSRIQESMMPMNELKKIFPAEKKFSLLQGTLFPEQIKEIAKSLADQLTESDSVPTFYFSVQDKDGKNVRTGVAIFSTSTKNPEKLIVGVGVDLSGKIINVALIKNKLSEKLKDSKFLDQFKDKTAESPLQIGKDIQPASSETANESLQVTDTVKKSLLIVAAVFKAKNIKPK